MKQKKKKLGRKNSWDGKMTKEFLPRHLPMRLIKQNHMTVSTTLRDPINLRRFDELSNIVRQI